MNTNNEFLEIVEQAEMEASVENSIEIDHEVADWRSQLISDGKGRYKSKQHNYNLIVANDENLKGHIKLDTFRNQITLHGDLPFGSYGHSTDLGDVETTKLLGYLGCEYELDNPKMTERAIRVVANANKYDSLLDRLESIVWDGRSRIETMLSILLGAEDSDYTREVAKLMMRGAVCRAYATNGIQFDVMVVLVGPQGCRKTSFCRCLALEPEYFEDNLGVLGSSEAARKVVGSLVVEMAELASVKDPRQKEAVKAFITRTHDSHRLLYLEEVRKSPRRCIFIGTTNDYQFLSGSYWNRRYIPIECGKYDTTFDWMDQENVKHFFEQVWAEAVEWYKSDLEGILKTLAPTPLILEENHKRQEFFKAEDPWYAPVEQYLRANEGREICAKELLVSALDLKPRDKKEEQASYKTIHELMHNMFPEWERVRDPKRLDEWGMQNSYYVHRSAFQRIEERL